MSSIVNLYQTYESDEFGLITASVAETLSDVGLTYFDPTRQRYRSGRKWRYRNVDRESELASVAGNDAFDKPQAQADPLLFVEDLSSGPISFDPKLGLSWLYHDDNNRLGYKIFGTGPSSYARVYVLESHLGTHMADQGNQDLLAVRFVSDEGILIANSGASGKAPTMTGVVGGTFDRIEGVTVKGLPDGLESAQMNLYRFELMGFDVSGESGAVLVSSNISVVEKLSVDADYQDQKAPEPVLSNIKNGATNVGLEPMLVVNYDEVVSLGESYRFFLEDESGVQQIVASSDADNPGFGSAWTEGAKLYVEFPRLQYGTKYFLKSDPGSLVDMSGNPRVPPPDNPFNFTTTFNNPNDVEGPLLTKAEFFNYTPTDAAPGEEVGPATGLRLTFNEFVNPLGDTAAPQTERVVFLFGSGGEEELWYRNIEYAGKTITLRDVDVQPILLAQLKAGGAVWVEGIGSDRFDNPIRTSISASFSDFDTAGPKVIDVWPKTGFFEDSQIVIDFDEEVNWASVRAENQLGESFPLGPEYRGKSLIINDLPTELLTPGNPFTLYIEGASDNFGNESSQIKKSITVSEVMSPGSLPPLSITSSDKIKGASTEILKVTFNNPIGLGDGGFQLVQSDGTDIWNEVANESSLEVQIRGNVATFLIKDSVQPGSTYRLVIDESAFVDQSIQGLTAGSEVLFTTQLDAQSLLTLVENATPQDAFLGIGAPSDGVIVGTQEGDRIAARGDGVTVIDLMGGQDKIFFSFNELGLPTFSGEITTSGASLTTDGKYIIKGFSEDDTAVVGIRTQDGVELESLKVIGNLAWLEPTELGRQKIDIGYLTPRNLIIEFEGAAPVDNLEFLSIPMVENSPLVYTGEVPVALELFPEVVEVYAVESSSSYSPSSPEFKLTDEVFAEASGLPLFISAATNNINDLFFDTANITNLTYTWINESLLEVKGAWASPLVEGELAPEDPPGEAPSGVLLYIEKGAVETLTIDDGEKRLIYELLSPELVDGEFKFTGTGDREIIYAASGKTHVDAGAGADDIYVGNYTGSSAAGGAELNRLIAPDASKMPVDARALTIDYSAADSVFANLSVGAGVTKNAVDYYSGAWANVIGSSTNDTIVGNIFGNELHGGAGDDRITAVNGQSEGELQFLQMQEFENEEAAGAGYWQDFDDYVFGGKGNDTYVVELNAYSAVRVHEVENEGSDTLVLGGMGGRLKDFASIVADARFYDYNEIATDGMRRWDAVELKNVVNNATVVSLTKNIETVVLKDSLDYADSAGIAFDSVAYGGRATTGDDLVLPEWNFTHVMGGGNGNDVILATNGSNVYLGGDGDDVIFAFGGNHRVIAGDGNDTVVTNSVESERSVVHLGRGNDRVIFDWETALENSDWNAYWYRDDFYKERYEETASRDSYFYEDLSGQFESHYEGEGAWTQQYTGYLHNDQHDNQAGRMLALADDSLVEDFVEQVVEVYRSDISPDFSKPTILDFRVGEDDILLASLSAEDDPQWAAVAFAIDGKYQSTRYFGNNAGSDDGRAAGGIVSFDTKTGHLSVGLITDTQDGELEVVSNSLGRFQSLVGAQREVVMDMFQDVSFDGYTEVNEEVFIVGLGAIDPFKDYNDGFMFS